MNLPYKLFAVVSLTMLSLMGFGQSDNYDPTHLYPVNALQTNFRFVRKTLESTHPNFYLHTPKAVFVSFLDSLYKCIIKSLLEMEPIIPAVYD